jgi:hypothetical protein
VPTRVGTAGHVDTAEPEERAACDAFHFLPR